MLDQAAALRQLVNTQEGQRNTRIVTVTSGKGGVGKSNFSLNFALALQRRGLQALLFDADVSFANIDVLLGSPATYNLIHLLNGEKTIWDIIQTGPHGLHFIAGGSGFQHLARLADHELEYFAEQVSRLYGHYDVVLFDTGAGLSKETVRFITAAHETIVVTTPEPTAITDAYALIKMLVTMGHRATFRLIVNKASDEREGHMTADNMRQVSEKYLGLDLAYLGCILEDPLVSKAVKRQTAFTLAYPDSAASRGVERITAAFLQEDTKQTQDRSVAGFLQRMRKLWSK